MGPESFGFTKHYIGLGCFETLTTVAASCILGCDAVCFDR